LPFFIFVIIMNAENLRPLNDLTDDFELWFGTRLRHTNIGMSVPKD